MAAGSNRLAIRPTQSIIARSIGGGLPNGVTRDQARSIINSAETTTHRLLLETLWQSAGRASEVLRLRPIDLDRAGSAMRLANLKQRRDSLREKLVYVSPDLIGQLLALAHDARLREGQYFFGSLRTANKPMTRQNLDLLIKKYAERAGVVVRTKLGTPGLPSALHFRHGSAIRQIADRVPLPQVQLQLGHARIDTTVIYTQVTDDVRREFADRVNW